MVKEQIPSAPTQAQETWDQTAARLSQSLYGLQAVELTGIQFEPLYRAGTVLCFKPGTAKPLDHVLIMREGMPSIIGQLIRQDEETLHVCGFKHGESMESISRSTITNWGRIVVAFKP